MKIGIFIPCYNVEKSIRIVLSSFPDEVLSRVAEIVAIDNKSTDSTFEALRRVQSGVSAIAGKLVIIRNHENYGLGGSQKIAYQYFLENGFTHFFIVHGDGQGDGEMIARNFFKVLDARPDVDLIMTSRFTRGSSTEGYNALRIFGNWVFNVITWACTGYWMSDSGAGIILYRTEILKRVPFVELTNSFQFNPELNILLRGLKDLKVVEIPLSWSDSRDKSNISSLGYCWTLLKILVRHRVNKTFLGRRGSRLFHPEPQLIAPRFDVVRPDPGP